MKRIDARRTGISKIPCLLLCGALLSCAPVGDPGTAGDSPGLRPAGVPPVAHFLAPTAEQEILASDSAGNLSYGSAIALSGDRAIVGANNAVWNGGQPGSAYLLVRSGGVWTEEAEIHGSDTGPGDGFGISVAISGDTALVGALAVDEGAALTSGAAYVFVRSNGVWTEQAKLVAADPKTNALFGNAVALSGDTALIGARGDTNAGGLGAGAAYVFVRSNGVWSQQAKLLSSSATPVSFGYAVALSGDTALVGGNTAALLGRADVFVTNNGAWTPQAALQPNNGAAGDGFGYAVSLSGDTALVGAFTDATKGANAGAAYVFERTGGAWAQQAKLLATAGEAGDYLGTAVALSGDVAVLGDYRDNTVGGADAGSAPIFARSGGAWTQQSIILAGDGVAQDWFGYAVAVEGDTVAVGAQLGGSAQDPSAGSAYFYLLRASNGDACGAGAECTSGFCVDGVCCDKACGGGAVDCQACSVAAGASVNGQCTTLPFGAVCRASAGACDAEETCGGGLSCPADAVSPSGTPCREAATSCDVAESCDGSVAACPADAFAADGTPCGEGTCQSGACDTGGAGGAGGGSGGGGNTGGAGGQGGHSGGGAGPGGGGAQAGGSSSGGNGNTGGAGGKGGNGEDPADSGGCGCRAAGDAPDDTSPFALLTLAVGLAAISRRRR